MKNISKIIGSFVVAASLLCGTLQCFGQETQERKVSSFSSVKVTGSMDVFLTEGSTETVKVEVKGIEADKISTEVEGETLVIKMKNRDGDWNFYSSKNTFVKVYVTYRALKAVANSGSSDIVCQSTIKSPSFDINLSGSGDFKADLDVKNLEVSVSGSADITLKGKAETQAIAISGSGDFEGQSLEGNNVTVRVSGSGDVNVWAKESIEARVSGSGDIIYKGNPSKEISKSSGSGTIRKG